MFVFPQNVRQGYFFYLMSMVNPSVNRHAQIYKESRRFPLSDIVKVSWSGGKDSSCAVMQHLHACNTVKVVCYIPMFTDAIPLITKVHYEFILRTADRFRQMGAEVYIVTGMTYYCYVTHRSTRGKFQGRAFGFPCFRRGQCGFKRDS